VVPRCERPQSDTGVSFCNRIGNCVAAGHAGIGCEKVDMALDFGWRSGLPLRYPARSLNCGFKAAELRLRRGKDFFRSLGSRVCSGNIDSPSLREITKVMQRKNFWYPLMWRLHEYRTEAKR
jgi:hypothetical protein